VKNLFQYRLSRLDAEQLTNGLKDIQNQLWAVDVLLDPGIDLSGDGVNLFSSTGIPMLHTGDGESTMQQWLDDKIAD
jgi:hypothetical protein